MSWRPRLVALDVDGTIVDHDGVLPDPVREAVDRVVAAGVPVVIATGRGWQGTQPIVEALGLPPGEHVCSNGAVTVAHPSGEVVETVTFDPTSVIESVRREAPEALIAVEDVGVGYRLTGLFPDGDLNGEMRIQTTEELCAEPVTRVIVRDPSSTDERFMALAEKLGLHGVSYFVGWTAWLDISPEGVDKASGLADVAARLGVDAADVLAIGDGRNDVGMLRWAGRGVAVGDAPEDVRVVADHVTATFDDGGTVAELDRWFPA